MRNKILFIIVLIVSLIFNHYSRAYSLFYNLILIGLLNIFFTFFLLKLNPFKKMGLIMIFFPVILTFSTFVYSLIFKEEIFIVNIIALIFTSVLGLYFYKYQNQKNNKYIVLLYVILFFTTIYYYEHIVNLYFDSFNEVAKNVKFPDIEIVDDNGHNIELPYNKVIIIDLWSNYCSNCIKEFPKFEALSKEFLNNDKIYFCSLNIFYNNLDVTKTKSLLQNYTFNNFYTNKDIFKKLNFNSVPNYVVLNRKMEVIYFGSLNTKFKNSESYIYDIIKNEFK